jgi:hypothetical protein
MNDATCVRGQDQKHPVTICTFRAIAPIGTQSCSHFQTYLIYDANGKRQALATRFFNSAGDWRMKQKEINEITYFSAITALLTNLAVVGACD